MKSTFAIFLSVLILGIAACADSPPLPTSPEQHQPRPASETNTSTPTIVTEPRFVTDLEVSGSLKPNTPVAITLRVKGLHHTDLASILLIAPELEAGRLTDFGDSFRIPDGVPLPQLISQQNAVPRGATYVFNETVVPAAPGYYRITGGVTRMSSETPSPGWISDASYETVWLWISEGGGKTTARFDPTLFPENALVAPGPLRFLPSEYGDNPQSNSSPEGRSLVTASHVIVEAQYMDNDNGGQATPMPYFLWEATWTDYSDPYNPQQRSTSGYTSNNGTFSPGCPDNYDSPYDVYVYAKSSKVMATWGLTSINNPSSIGYTSIDQGDCITGGTKQIVATDDKLAEVVINGHNTATNASSSFGHSRPLLRFALYTSGSRSWYCTDRIALTGCIANQDYVRLDDQSVWALYGQFVTAHEYGHAYQEKALSLLFADFNDSCSSHGYSTPSSMGCAVSEGFANYFAETMGEAPRYNDETGDRVITDGDGSIVEGAVAAFFHDLTDSADDDVVGSYPFSYVGDIVKTCRWNFWGKPSGIDHLIFCFENDIDPAITNSNVYFPERQGSFPNSISEGASEPTGWDKMDIRDVWTWNLYDE